MHILYVFFLFCFLHGTLPAKFPHRPFAIMPVIVAAVCVYEWQRFILSAQTSNEHLAAMLVYFPCVSDDVQIHIVDLNLNHIPR